MQNTKITQARTAVLLGASGLTGSFLLQLLLQNDFYSKIRVIVRSSFSFVHPKLEIVAVDFQNQKALDDALDYGDTIFCCIGTTMKKVRGNKTLYRQIDFDIPLNTAQLGIQKGFRKYVIISSVGANAKSSNFYLHLKGDLENTLQELPYDSIHIFRPSILIGKRKEIRTGERIAQVISIVFSSLLWGALKKYRAISSEEVARAMLTAVQTEEKGIHIHEYIQIKEGSKNFKLLQSI